MEITIGIESLLTSLPLIQSNTSMGHSHTNVDQFAHLITMMCNEGRLAEYFKQILETLEPF